MHVNNDRQTNIKHTILIIIICSICKAFTMEPHEKRQGPHLLGGAGASKGEVGLACATSEDLWDDLICWIYIYIIIIIIIIMVVISIPITIIMLILLLLLLLQYIYIYKSNNNCWLLDILSLTSLTYETVSYIYTYMNIQNGFDMIGIFWNGLSIWYY
jgi:hypothetical protein